MRESYSLQKASNGEGTFIIDRRLRAVGRIKRASGTTDPETFAAIQVAITRLLQTGQWDTLDALKDGRLHPLRLIANKRLPRFRPAPLGPVWLYAILRADTNEVKIGFSRNVENRFKLLQAAHGEPLELLGKMRSTVVDEQFIHTRFAKDRKLGEWFNATPEILEWARAL